MFKELICAVALSGTIGMTAPQNSNDGTYYQDVTITETYEYETNEVNSVDDLVIGNIYHFEITENTIPTNISLLTIRKLYNLNYNYLVGNTSSNLIIESLETTGNDSFTFRTTTSYYVFRLNYGNNENYNYLPIYYSNNNGIKFDFVFDEIFNANEIIDYISASDYLGEKSITITPKEFNGLFSIFDNFLHERLFSGGILDTTNVTVFNATMSLGQWLSTTTSIVLLCLIVLLLVLLIKFIFKYVGGMMIWRS